jgi:hypothetical protein
MREVMRVAFVATFAFALAGSVGADGGPATATTPAAQLAAVDRIFVAAYGRAVSEVLAGGPPAFLVLPDRLVLHRSGARQEWPLIPPLFNELKTVAHVTLGLFAILSPTDGGPLAATDVIALQQYQGEIAAARSAIGGVSLNAAQAERQQQILTASAQLTTRALADGRVAAADLTDFCRRMRPLIDANIAEAVVAYLDELNRVMTAALPVLTTRERAEYLVIVSGVHQARIDNATLQYFDRLLHNPPVISQRLMYAENVFDEAGALHLLGVHLMARRVGTAYFDDLLYMNRDLFAPAAAAYVPTMHLPPEVE